MSVELKEYEQVLVGAGWFIPPYVPLAQIINAAERLKHVDGSERQNILEQTLKDMYWPERLAAMSLYRYAETPVLTMYKEIISESIEAHYLGLDHIAVSGLLPVIEGAARSLAEQRGIGFKGVRTLFVVLCDDCKQQAQEERLGTVNEVCSMMDSFKLFCKQHLYQSSEKYFLEDNTNRHGILHGSFSDKDYGRPLNFYKCLAAVEFLCWISAFKANVSWLLPGTSNQSKALGAYYQSLEALAVAKRNIFS
ncbi:MULTISPECIES: hypothetical protein [Vibrio]|uniref:Uncharacterized protein n=1 Tax=Vibrio mimicus TaxID=674 RepID=A0A2J9VJA9_VIBMI|nr:MULTISPECIES: hypothetical protein [Vibrio]EEO01226.1 hypothetical protein VCA_000157 [Vibrio cholerae VL426]EEW10060.1 hypothetical protein VMD_24560 [Vibrio mimicus VM573]EFH72420.1 conserved hypothetical protein [Vibrio cholerae RC385]EKF9423053.1 hypothetical protein [Vibrio cholerae]KFE29352.1 hypothetical protein DN31_3941 [Vibrio mimicus]